MAVDPKYGKFDIPGVPEDMPVMVFLAKDAVAMVGISAYMDECEALELIDKVPSKHIGAIRKVIQIFDDYPVDAKKLPD